jgi:hypothetical protein
VDGNKRPYSSQWNLTIERELPQSFFIAVSYVGTKGTHLPSQNSPINVLNPFNTGIQAYQYVDATGSSTSHLLDTFGPNDTVVDGVPAPYAGWYGQVHSSCGGATVALALAPYPQYCGTMAGLNEGHGNSIYESVQGKIERHFHNGLYAMASGTLAKLYTNAAEATQATAEGAGSGSVSPFDPARQRAIAADNVPFTGSVAVVYDLPIGRNKQFLNNMGAASSIIGGWQVSPIIRYEYGIPFSINSANCKVVSQFRQSCLPGILPGQQVLLHSRNGFDPSKTNGQLINPAAFESNFSQFGYTGYGKPVTTVYAPGYRNIDASLIKNTKITEAVNFQFRANFFNAFNNHYFVNQGGNTGASYAFNTSVGAPSFGQWNGTVSSPRTIQFAARVEF